MGWKRTTVGEIKKDKNDPKKSYLELKEAIEPGFFNLESPKDQLASLEEAFANEKISEEIYNKQKERIEKIPDFVRFQMIKVERVD